MSNSIVNPLQNLLSSASKKLPKTTNNVDSFKKRLEHKGKKIILADISESMNLPAWSNYSRIEVLRESVNSIRDDFDKIITFNDSVHDSSENLDKASGSTELDKAIKYIKKYNPSVTLIICDGEPNSEVKALSEAEILTGIINVLFIGSEHNAVAINFMKQLARTGHGKYQSSDFKKPDAKKLLTENIKRLLLK